MPRTTAPADGAETCLPALRHGLPEDAQALVPGGALHSFSVRALTAARLVPVHAARSREVPSNAHDRPFGLWSFVLDRLVHALEWLRGGHGRVARTAVAITLVYALSASDRFAPWATFLLTGAVIAVSFVTIFHRGASLGGSGILAPRMRERFGVRADRVRRASDAVLVAGAFAMLDARLAAALLAGAVVIAAVDHRRGRDVGR